MTNRLIRTPPIEGSGIDLIPYLPEAKKVRDRAEGLVRAIEDLRRVAEKLPLLTCYGIHRPSIIGEPFQVAREALFSPWDASSFLRARDWLIKAPRVKKPYPESAYSTERLRNVAKYKVGYLGGGAFIAACIHCEVGIRFAERTQYAAISKAYTSLTNEEMRGSWMLDDYEMAAIRMADKMVFA